MKLILYPVSVFFNSLCVSYAVGVVIDQNAQH